MARTESNKHSSDRAPPIATAANSQQIPGGPVSREDRGLLVSNGSSAGKGRWGRQSRGETCEGGGGYRKEIRLGREQKSINRYSD